MTRRWLRFAVLTLLTASLTVAMTVALTVASPSALAQQVVAPPVPADAVPVADLAPVAGAGRAWGSGRFDPAGGAGLAYPLARPALELAPWGWRWSEARQRWRPHTGIDLITPAGTEVRAVAAGRVLLAEEVSGYGLTLLLEHPGGWRSLYAHLQQSSAAAGQMVERGQPIGTAGASGNASTPQLHFELHQAPEGSWLAIDPAPLLAAPTAATSVAGALPPP